MPVTWLETVPQIPDSRFNKVMLSLDDYITILWTHCFLKNNRHCITFQIVIRSYTMFTFVAFTTFRQNSVSITPFSCPKTFVDLFCSLMINYLITVHIKITFIWKSSYFYGIFRLIQARQRTRFVYNYDTTYSVVAWSITNVYLTTCSLFFEFVSDAESLCNARRASGKFGGVAGVFAGVTSECCEWQGIAASWKNKLKAVSNCQFPACKSFFAWSTAHPATFTNWFIIACCRIASISSRKSEYKAF